MIRKPNAKSQAEILITDLAAMGFELQRGKALDLVAKLHGYRSWNQYAAAEKGTIVIPASAPVMDSELLVQSSEMVTGYETPLPKSLFSADGTVSDHHLAAYKSHRKDDITVLLYDVDFNGQPAKRDVAFKDLAIGEMFYDPDCGEDFRKTGTSTAEIMSGGDMTGEDEFSPDEIVERERYTLQLSGFSRYRVNCDGVGDGVSTMVNSSTGLTKQMEAIITGQYPGLVEPINNPWFEWLNEDDQIIGEPFTELPADPKQAVEQYLKPYLSK